MTSTVENCRCSELGYSPDCPLAFYQGGKILHSIESESKLKPRVFGSPDVDKIGARIGESEKGDKPPAGPNDVTRMRDEIMNGNRRTITDFHAASPESGFSWDTESDELYDEVRNHRALTRSSTTPAPLPNGRGRLLEDSEMMEHNRRLLRKFEPLHIGTKTLTGLTIGGYAVDLGKAAQKASEVAPLPPSKLPIIFADDDMNFHHHFFQGLDMLLGQDVVQEIVSTGKYYQHSELLLLPMIEDMIRVGYKDTDNEITVFCKKVLTSTFSMDHAHDKEPQNRVLHVDANLWGFQYIECGMQMREVDLKMWLQNCHRHYKMIWFNTFKSAGIPHFALEGVQTRYEAPGGRSDDLIRKKETVSAEEINYLAKELDILRTEVSARRHRHRRGKDAASIATSDHQDRKFRR